MKIENFIILENKSLRNALEKINNNNSYNNNNNNILYGLL